MSNSVSSTICSLALAAAVVVAGGLWPGAPVAHAQGDPNGGPSFDQLIRTLPESLPGMTRAAAERWERMFAQGRYERTSGDGPSPVYVRLGHGDQIQYKIEQLAQQQNADTTRLSDGRPVYSFSRDAMGKVTANVVWLHDGYTLWMSVAKKPDQSFDAAAAQEEMRALLAGRLTADQLPEVESNKASMPAAAGFKAPEGFSSITAQYGGAAGKDARISVAYPSDWTALDASQVNSFAKVIDISRKESTIKQRWYSESDTESDVLRHYASDEVHIQVAGPGMVSPYVGQIDPMDGLKPDETKSNVENATVVQSPTQTTVAGRNAATMTVAGTSADGYSVRHRVVCIASNGAVPCVTITRPSDRSPVSDATIQAILESVTAEVIADEG